MKQIAFLIITLTLAACDQTAQQTAAADTATAAALERSDVIQLCTSEVKAFAELQGCTFVDAYHMVSCPQYTEANFDSDQLASLQSTLNAQFGTMVSGNDCNGSGCTATAWQGRVEAKTDGYMRGDDGTEYRGLMIRVLDASRITLSQCSQ